MLVSSEVHKNEREISGTNERKVAEATSQSDGAAKISRQRFKIFGE
jgi:hypothetical protein